jgi:hypothetical protein
MWEDGLEPSSVAIADPRAPHLHIQLAMDGEHIMAGLVWEYYPVSNCVLVCPRGFLPATLRISGLVCIHPLRRAD